VFVKSKINEIVKKKEFEIRAYLCRHRPKLTRRTMRKEEKQENAPQARDTRVDWCRKHKYAKSKYMH